jgi:DNA repair protein REV1
MGHADDLQAVSVDEALIEVTSSIKAAKETSDSERDYAQDLAELIRAQVKQATDCDGTPILPIILFTILTTRFYYSQHRHRT